MKSPSTFLALALCALLCACQGTSEPATVGASASEPANPAPAKGEPAKGVVDYSCSRNEECAIKNVGNCCGEYPACVNADSPTFPEQVKADCAKKGMMGVCGFPVLQGCQCIEGRCESIKAAMPPPNASSIR